MATRRLLGAARIWAGWGTRELLDPASPRRLLVRDYAKKPGELGGRRVALIPACALVRLFEMNLGPPKTLEELDPETREYWRLLRKQNIWRHNRLSKNKKL
ncbi:PREDICTED: 39S ribosomal protein L54, mitochondrial [Mandrillus leucophaeus]|uniref:39S ribosomal protein L54, mitochondrial n=1 Tax=Mandrillus leucophaeus TaxID=9568 RepID=UPI0005F38AEB|nr:PREDICTED: 39S ribosomal protein L54, mitochondrial [Mandrillus leucophaeus]